MSSAAEFEYHYPPDMLDLARLAEAFRDHFCDFSTAPDHLSVSMRPSGSEARYTYDDFDQVIAAPPQSVEELDLTASWYGENKRRFSVELYRGSRALSLRCSVLQQEAERVAGAIAAFETQAGLSRVAREGPDIAPSHHFSQEFILPDCPYFELLTAFETKLAGALSLEVADGTVTTLKELRREETLRSGDEIRERLLHDKSWTRIEIAAKDPRSGGQVSLEIRRDDLSSLGIRGWVRQSDTAALDLATAAFIDALALEPWEPLWKRQDRLVSARSRSGWLEASRAVLKRLEEILREGDAHIVEWSGSVLRLGHLDSDTLSRAPDALASVQSLGQDWQRVASLSLSATGYAASLDLFLEPALASAQFRVRAVDAAQAEALSDAIVAGLGIELVEGPLYDRTRLLRRFSVPYRWSGELFAREIRKEIQLRIGKAPVIVEANVGAVGDDETEVIEHKDDLDSWLARLAAPGPYASAYVHARGPRGRELSIWLGENRRKLELRGAMPADEFEEMVRLLKRSFDLDPVSEMVPAKSFLGRLFDMSTTVGRIAAAVVAALIGIIGFVAGEFRGQLFPNYEIQLLSPATAADGEVRVEAGCVLISWEVHRTWVSPDGELDRTGDVHLQPASGRAGPTISGHRSGTSIHLSPGRYSLFVRDPELAERTPAVWVEVVDHDYASDADTATSDCGSPVL